MLDNNKQWNESEKVNPTSMKLNAGVAGSVFVLLVSIVILMSAGCNTMDGKKQAMYDQWQKTSASAKVPLARELFEAGRSQESLKMLEECLQADPDMPEANLLMGKIHLTEGRQKRAESCFAKAVEIAPSLDEGFYWLGVIAQNEEHFDKSLEYHKKALELKPLDIKYILAVSDSYVSSGEMEQALHLLEQKNKSVSKSAELKVAIGDMYQNMGKTVEAVSMYKQALLLKGHDADIITALGYCYISQKNWNMAVKEFEKLIADSQGSDLVSRMELIASCSMNAGEYGKAMDYYDKLSVAKRGDISVWLKMGEAALGANATSRAIACADRVLAMKSGCVEAVLLKGCGQYLAGDYELAVKTLSQAIGDKKTGGFAWMISGRCYQQMGLSNNAEHAYKNAKQLAPDSMLAGVLSSGAGQIDTLNK